MSTALVSGGRAVGIVPSTFDDVQRVAKALVAAGMGSFAWNDDDQQKIAKATAQIMTGLELGIPPMQAMANIAIINGRPQVWGDLVPALLLAAGFDFDMETRGEGDGRHGWAWLRRPNGTEREFTFTVQQAKDAGLWDRRPKVMKKGKGGTSYEAENDSAWYRYADDMLRWKAVARVVKVGAADVMKGVAVREDMDRASDAIDITPKRAATPAADIPFDDIDQTPPDDGLPTKDITAASDDEWPLDQQAAFIGSIENELAAADSLEIIQEIAESNAEQVARFSPRNRVNVARLYSERMEEFSVEAAE